VSEEQTELLRNLWQQMQALSRKLAADVARIEAKLDAKADKADLETASAQLNARIDRSDLRVDRLADQMSEGFVRVTHRIDALDEKLTRRFERVEARLDGIDGRLTTLTATVALHELKLKDAR
jgi:hypothetical protein